MVRPAILTCWCLALAGCGAAEHTPAVPVVRDSNGVTIVENTRGIWNERTRWRLADSARVEIGDAGGRPEYALFRVSSATRLGDGRIVLANGGTNEVRFYGAAGEFLLTTGGSGEGPGEFLSLQRLWRLSADSLLAYDFGPARLTVYAPQGRLVRTYTLRSPDGRQIIVRGALGDGSIIAEGVPLWDASAAATGVVRDSAPLYRFDAGGQLVGSLGHFVSAEVYRRSTPDGLRMASLPFARIPKLAIGAQRVYFASTEAFIIDVHSPDGTLERSIRLAHEPRRVTEEDLDRFRSERLAMAEEEGTRAEMERLLSELPVPDRMPAVGALLVDIDEHLWVADYRAAPDERAGWRVFRPDGVYLGEVEMPHGFDPLQIGTDFILGRWRDELDVERVRWYELTRGIQAPPT